ncbi:MAG: hypothetical protein GXO23_03895 [Crenarchaeota archaeon]|nr:hypothetical protein [Thermoproteota archaeon]
MEISVKVLRETKEILIEHLEEPYDLKIFQDIDKAVQYLREMIERALDSGNIYESQCTEEGKSCTVKTWYIRIPPERLLNILRFAYQTKCEDVKKLLNDYLSVTGLSKSNIRVITPTLSALRLSLGNRLTEQALLIGKYLSENSMDKAMDMLFELALTNCMLREIIEELYSTDTNTFQEVVKRVLERKGNLRKDELTYTTDLVKLLYRHSVKCRCFIVKNLFRTYLYERRKVYINNVPGECLLDIVELLIQYVRDSKPYMLQVILDPARSRVDRIELVRKDTTLLLYDKQSEAYIQVVPKVMITRDVLYASMLRQELEKLRSELQQKCRQSKITYMLMVLILVNDMYTKAKLYLEHILRDEQVSSRIIDLP